MVPTAAALARSELSDQRAWRRRRLGCGDLSVGKRNGDLHAHKPYEMRYRGMLLTVALLLLLFWGVGISFHVAGGLIHGLLLVALGTFILHLARGGRNY